MKRNQPARRRKAAGAASTGISSYLILLAATLVYAVVSIGAFFGFVDRQINAEVSQGLAFNLNRQVLHLEAMLDQQFRFLEGMAAYLGNEETLVNDRTLALLAKQREHTDVVRLCVVDEQGNAVYDDGATSYVADREYFIRSIAGERVLSDPLDSRVDDTPRVVMAVPMYNAAGELRGMLGGSYDISALNSMLFEGVYGTDGYALIVAEDGQIIASNGNAENREAPGGVNLFEHYRKLTGKNTLAALVGKDFTNQTTGVQLVPVVERSRYIAYQSLSFNDWMVCYVVDVERAMEGYSFILNYEVVLMGVLMVGLVLLLIATFIVNHRRQRAIQKAAQVDELTGALNKASATEAIEQRLAGSQGTQHLLLMMDVDYFKRINDTYGHAVGDEVLRRIGATLRKYFRDTDIVGRMGGDEFIVLMCDVQSYDHAMERLQALRQRFARLEVPGAEGHTVTCSVGISRFPDHGRDFDSLFECADVALYRTKSNGRNGITIYNGDMAHRAPGSGRKEGAAK